MMLSITLSGQLYANEFKVGFAELPITPDLIDEWEDCLLYTSDAADE